jgi:thiol-disulfide isomerase/thioredoxin
MNMTNLSHPLRAKRQVLLAAMAACLLFLSCDGARAGDGPPVPKADFQLKTIDGRTLGPKDFRGQVVVVDFWATWCGPCHLQARILEPVYRDFKGRGVQFLAANVGEEPEQVKKFLKDKPFPYPVLLDPGNDISAELGVAALPTLMVVDKKGKVTYFESGIADGDTLRQIIKKAGA